MSRLIDKVRALEAKNAKSIRKQEFWSSLDEDDQALFRGLRSIFGQYRIEFDVVPHGVTPFAPPDGEVPYGDYRGNVSRPQVFGRFCKRKLPQKSFGSWLHSGPGESSESEADDL